MYKKIKRKISNFGVKETTKFLIKRTLNTLFHSKRLFFRVDVRDYQPMAESIKNNVVILEKGSVDDISNIELNALKNHSGHKIVESIEKKLSLGFRLFLLYLNNQLAGASWVYTGGENRLLVVPLTKKDYIIVDVFTLDEFRGKGTAVTNLVKIIMNMKEEGFQFGYISTKEWNFYQKAIAKAGFRLIGKYYKFNCFKKRIIIWSSGFDKHCDG